MAKGREAQDHLRNFKQAERERAYHERVAWRWSMSEAESKLIEGVPASCGICGAPLCVRKQTINLALGNDRDMRCLLCLGSECGGSAACVLSNSRGYILSRDCFSRQWNRYLSQDDCPDRGGCIPDICFGGERNG